VVTVINPSRTTSYASNSRVTEPNLKKFLHNVQKSLLINLLQSKLPCSIICFGMTVCQMNDDHRIVAESRQKIPQTSFLNSEVTGPLSTTL